MNHVRLTDEETDFTFTQMNSVNACGSKTRGVNITLNHMLEVYITAPPSDSLILFRDSNEIYNLVMNLPRSVLIHQRIVRVVNK